MKKVKECCHNCKRFYSFDYDEKKICICYSEHIEDIYIPTHIKIYEFVCSNFILKEEEE